MGYNCSELSSEGIQAVLEPEKVKRAASEAVMHPKKILHPTDYTEWSRPALMEAISLAQEHGAHLVLLHVVDSLGLDGLPYSESATSGQPAAHRHKLFQELRDVLPPHAHVDAEFVLSEEEIVTAILRTQIESGCDLIVLGSHGKTGWRRWFNRSIAEEVVRRAACPVLVVKPEREPEHLAEFGATDLHPGHLSEG